MMRMQTTIVPNLPYRPRTLSLFDDPTKRIDLFQLEAHLHRSRRTDVTAVVPPPDDFDTRKTTQHRAVFPPPPMRPVYPTRRDPLPLFFILVLLSTCCAVASLVMYG
jgi:hypothetical protein